MTCLTILPSWSKTTNCPERLSRSSLRAALNATRSTNVSLDYAIDQAVVSNRGGGRPTEAIIGNVRQIESLEKLGPLTARIERIRKLCGV